MAPLEPEVLTYSRRTLEKLKVGSTITQSLQYDMDRSVFADELVHRLTAYVLADHICDETFTAYTSIDWPETTWQMFKSRHATSWWLGWLVRRRPVRMHHERRDVAVEVKRYLGYPEASIVTPSLGAPVIIEQPRQVEWFE